MYIVDLKQRHLKFCPTPMQTNHALPPTELPYAIPASQSSQRSRHRPSARPNGTAPERWAPGTQANALATQVANDLAVCKSEYHLMTFPTFSFAQDTMMGPVGDTGSVSGYSTQGFGGFSQDTGLDFSSQSFYTVSAMHTQVRSCGSFLYLNTLSLNPSAFM